ncbi:MAG: phytoene/squalene synthase family protein [Gemmatimonadaceae bacterium]|nr:phytoene/squalene synthase family protein [Gemmatimonadaceae bacterium]
MPAADAQRCERILRTHSRTFYLASLFLPPEKRRGALALYAFCRLADDIVDDATMRGTPPDEIRRRLSAHTRGLDCVYNGKTDSPVFREIAWTVQRFGVPREPLDELLEGVALDLGGCRYRTWSDLERYCQGVASSVGEMCTYVWGVRGDASLKAAVGYARTLGTAMQLTNILRDVGEDAHRRRCYLPEEDLDAYGFSPDDVLEGRVLQRRDAWTAFTRGQIDRAVSLYAAAAPGIALLSFDAQRCASACAAGYASILDAIEGQDYDNVTRRASVGWLGRAGVLARAWLGPLAPFPTSGSGRAAAATLA